MSWGDTLILVISRGVQLYYGIAHSNLLGVLILLGCITAHQVSTSDYLYHVHVTFMLGL